MIIIKINTNVNERLDCILMFLTVQYYTTGAAAAYGIGFSSTDWSRWGEVALGALSALEGGALFTMVFSDNIWVCYCGYILFKSLYMLLITIAMQVLFKIRDLIETDYVDE